MIRDTSAQDRVIVRKRHRGVWWIAIAVTLTVVVVAAFLPSFRRWSRAEMSFDKSKLSLATLTRGVLVRDLGVEGRIVASSYPTLYSPAEGTIELKVKAGDQVTTGQVLAEIDSPELRNRLQQELSQVQSLEAELSRQKITAKTTQLANQQDIDLKKLQYEAAQRAFERAKQTFAQGLINATEYEEAEDRVKITELEYRNAANKAKLDAEMLDFEIRNRALQSQRQQFVLEEIRRRVSELAMKSPVDGVVGTVTVDPRDFVSINQAVLTVIDLSAFEIEIAIPESYADEIAGGIDAEINYENQIYPGMVASVAPEVNNSLVTGTVVFTGGLPRGLRQNQRVSTRIILSTKADALKVRRGPFLESGGGRKAFVVKEGLAVLRPITIGLTSMTEVEILSGLREGDTIIISDISRFENAETVLLRN